MSGAYGKTIGEAKRTAPGFIGNMIPALTGDEGERTTTGRRRYYMRFAKQGWEEVNWFKEPIRALFSKSSMPVQRLFEGLTGRGMATGWEMPFEDKGFWERWFSLDGEKSATLNMFKALVPFSVMGMNRNPEVGILSAVGPVSKGISKTAATKEMAKIFMDWADSETFISKYRGKPGAYTDLKSMVVPYLEALRRNGYDPKEELKMAITAARTPLYEIVHNSIPRFEGGDIKTLQLEKAARGLYRLNYIWRDMLSSLKARDKKQNIKRGGDFARISNLAIRDAFLNPNGPVDPRLTRSAARGGDVTSFLASDEVPQSVLGYAVKPVITLSDDDHAFFKNNPEVAGFYDPR